ncbi:MAG: hypothetical protein KDD40_05000 [Bdellovibrionales bacterium]|nr:hypothetical protein [Bdellovibrionales bacterium]
MPYEVYKIIHVVGIMVLFLSLGAMFFTGFNHINADKKQRRPWMIMHGVSLFFILLGGFGLLARLGVTGSLPLWIWFKLAIWLIFGAMAVILRKKVQWSQPLLAAVIVLGLIAAYIATYKPFH